MSTAGNAPSGVAFTTRGWEASKAASTSRYAIAPGRAAGLRETNSDVIPSERRATATASAAPPVPQTRAQGVCGAYGFSLGGAGVGEGECRTFVRGRDVDAPEPRVRFNQSRDSLAGACFERKVEIFGIEAFLAEFIREEGL